MKAALINKQYLGSDEPRYFVQTIVDVHYKAQLEEMQDAFGSDYILLVDGTVRKGMIFDSETNKIYDVRGNLVFPTPSAAEKVEEMQKHIDELTYNVDEESLTLEELKEYLIKKNKKNLEDYLYNNPMVVDGRSYTVTAEKQNQLTGMLNAYTYAKAIGIEIPLSWNESGAECESYEFEELMQLYLQMLDYVKPIVVYQQHTETLIRAAETNEEVKAIDITFDNYTG